MPSAAEENNRTIFIRTIGNWNKGNLSEYLQLYDPSVVLHGYMGVVESSLERVKKFYQRFWAAFSRPKYNNWWYDCWMRFTFDKFKTCTLKNRNNSTTFHHFQNLYCTNSHSLAIVKALFQTNLILFFLQFSSYSQS